MMRTFLLHFPSTYLPGCDTDRQLNATQIEELGTKPLANSRQRCKLQQRAAASPSTGSWRLPGLKVRLAGWIKHVKSIAIYTDWDLGAGTIKYHLFHLRCSFGLHIDGCYFISHEWLSIFLWALRSLALSLTLLSSYPLTLSLFPYYVSDPLSLFYHSFHRVKYLLYTLLYFSTLSSIFSPILPLF